jgi:amino acid permease
VDVGAVLQDKSDANCMFIAWSNIFVVITFYLVLMLFSFFTFGSFTKSQFMLNYKNAWYEVLVRIMFAAMMLTAVPCNFRPLRQSGIELVDYVRQMCEGPEKSRTKGPKKPKAKIASIKADAAEQADEDLDEEAVPKPKCDVGETWHRVVGTALPLFTAVCAAKCVDGAVTVINYLGASLAPLLMLGLPAYMIQSILDPKDRNARICMWLFYGYTVVCFAVFFLQILDDCGVKFESTRDIDQKTGLPFLDKPPVLEAASAAAVATAAPAKTEA